MEAGGLRHRILRLLTKDDIEPGFETAATMIYIGVEMLDQIGQWETEKIIRLCNHIIFRSTTKGDPC